MASVADLLALDELLDKMPPPERAMIERAIEHRLDGRRRGSNYEEGFNDGMAEGRRRERAAHAHTPAEGVSGT